jgi:hypothetical protein
MARTENFFKEVDGQWIEPIWPLGRDFLLIGSNKYFNFGADSGSSGYGFRDNGGTMQVKNSGGAWANFASGAGVTVADSAEIDFTLTGQEISASIIAGSIDETKLDASVNASLDLADSALQAANISDTAYDDTSWNGVTTVAPSKNAIRDKINTIDTAINAKPTISSGAGAPASTPTKVGDIYIDTTGDDAYLAVGTASSADWEKTNDGTGGGISDGDKGDITVSSSGAVWNIDNDVVTYAKIQNVSATDIILGRSSIGAGDIEEIACTAFARSILDDANEATFKATVNLEIGVDVQAYDADLTTWAGLTPSANAQSLVTSASYATMRALLDLEAGTDFYSISAANAAFQPLDADLTTIAGLTATTNNFIVSVASAWASRTPAQVRTTLGIGSAGLVATDLADLNEATIEAAIDTLANLTSIQGRTVTLADAGADAILGWDDSANAYENLTQAEVLAVIGNAAADGTTKGVATFAAADFDAASGVISIDYTNGQKASTTQAGLLTEIAIASEVNTGTDVVRAVSPDALAGSYAGTKSVSIEVFGGTTAVATGDGKAYITIPEALNGMDLIRATATVTTAGTTNATTVMIHNLTDAVDMLSGAISIASAGTTATAGTVNGSNDSVATNDRIRIDVDSVSSTPPQGLQVVLEFRLP